MLDTDADADGGVDAAEKPYDASIALLSPGGDGAPPGNGDVLVLPYIIGAAGRLGVPDTDSGEGLDPKDALACWDAGDD